MPLTDLPLDALRLHRSAVRRPADLDAFWARSIDDSRALGQEPRVQRIDAGLRIVDVFDMTFSGWAGEPVRAWLHRPAGADGPLPTVVRFVGYNCGRALPHMVHPLALAGYAVLTMDNRGQGTAAGYTADTPDSGGAVRVNGGHVTRGLGSPDEYYYRRLYTDAVLAVEAARALPGTDPDRLFVAGVSQGGGIALAAAGLADGIAGALIDVPFLSDVPRALELSPTIPYSELSAVLASYPREAAAMLEVLAYFDGVNLAPRATAPALFSVGLMDPICPPSTVFAAYNAYAGEKAIEVYPYGAHEGGGFAHEAVQLQWIAERLGAGVTVGA